ncbi:hypothetical protein [Microbacterium album]|uniref:Uncharacterized protein n=1 Tax=Microbacterium album TaxID=2053191 RepID=A0A917IC49_9MICO|nr:hypothetical protein [Microbacterium album]GGH34029.1 hypothetical protein GCM10010921_01420 [Microbacterium album]
MATGSKGRRMVDAIDDVAAELRLANRIAVLKLGASALDHDPGSRATTDVARERVARMNRLRAEIRAGLGLDGEGA